jgi:hypothetical protein
MSKRWLTDVFFQVNTIKGHRYLDDAGKIMNRWDSEFPNKDVGIVGLLMRNPDTMLRELRVDSRTIWIHFSLPERLRQVAELSVGITTEICGILEVTQFSRVGLRIQLIYNMDDVAGENGRVTNNIFVPALQAVTEGRQPGDEFEFTINTGTKQNPVTLRVAAVEKKSEAKTPAGFPEHGLLVDADIFQKQTSYLDDLKRFMRSAQDWIDNELPTIEDAILGGRQHG